MSAARLRQWWADLLSRFWLRPGLMCLVAVVLSETLVRLEGRIELPSAVADWVYAGGVGGARDVLQTIAAASIAVAGTTFSITVAALTLATSQMGPRLLRNFTRDAGNQYALGLLVATFVYALVALRSVHENDNSSFVPQLALTGALALAFASVGALIWFLHHMATSINVDRVIALVQVDLVAALRGLPERDAESSNAEAEPALPEAGSAPLELSGSGYIRVLDDEALADWAEEHDAVLLLSVRPGGYVLPGSVVGWVSPAGLQEEAQEALASASSLGPTRDVEQDLEFAVRQLVEVGLRALSPSTNDPFTAISVLDHLGAGLGETARRTLPSGVTCRNGVVRLRRPSTDYEGLVDAMFHMLRQSGAGEPSVMIRLLEVLAEVARLEPDPERRRVLRRHVELAHDAAREATSDPSARTALARRYDTALTALASKDPRGPGPIKGLRLVT
ncbi:DUF2254 domain-containing protein [Sabulicella glaciei]|uniref:DUF2254 domain-containing protein n=1 Tax=Sabulicella glaciei TaxID=2984948 RepID=UPI0026582223